MWYNICMDKLLRALLFGKKTTDNPNNILFEQLMRDKYGNYHTARITWGNGKGPLITQEVQPIGAN